MKRMKYKLFVNNLQIGYYANMKDLVKSALDCVGGRYAVNTTFKGNSCYVKVVG